MVKRQAARASVLVCPGRCGLRLRVGYQQQLAQAAGRTACLIVSSAIIDKYIGESVLLIREMVGYARDRQPCIIFMDEIDAIDARRFSEGTNDDHEIQRTLLELLIHLDGFHDLGKVCCLSGPAHL
ncbi:26S proteasome regulatory subunit 10B homolog A-like isoform X2 [Aegilops tauschii subsp. strangulata]|uniref:26S proteasome regulatory subunit 10B homolog A-like isoform X2 n=1 Tax=Aegilops tauschii subsp. strangulata TaxID=200361 RepID=UPI001E1CACDB|nr:26S proteasome regulatory subunit 10B homolog A-like isoform X2 [Aegilops tauschii subsp. strangulata]